MLMVFLLCLFNKCLFKFEVLVNVVSHILHLISELFVYWTLIFFNGGTSFSKMLALLRLEPSCFFKCLFRLYSYLMENSHFSQEKYSDVVFLISVSLMTSVSSSLLGLHSWSSSESSSKLISFRFWTLFLSVQIFLTGNSFQLQKIHLSPGPEVFHPKILQTHPNYQQWWKNCPCY